MLDRLAAGYSVALLEVDAAGILLADAHGVLHAVASSIEDAELLELLQLQAERGPCVDCYHGATGSPAPLGRPPPPLPTRTLLK